MKPTNKHALFNQPAGSALSGNEQKTPPKKQSPIIIAAENDEVPHLHLNGLIYTHLLAAIQEVKQLCSLCVRVKCAQRTVQLHGQMGKCMCRFF